MAIAVSEISPVAHLPLVLGMLRKLEVMTVIDALLLPHPARQHCSCWRLDVENASQKPHKPPLDKMQEPQQWSTGGRVWVLGVPCRMAARTDFLYDLP
jgi:hypothetical protein